MNITKFKPVDAVGDIEYLRTQRIISGRLTPKRYKILTKDVRRFNYEHSAPYGRSQCGYAYRCGCEHDCCGCMTGEWVDIDFINIGVNRVQIKLTYTIGFNY